MGAEIRILELPRVTRSYRFDDRTLERLNKLARRLPSKSDTAILEDAIAHLLGTLERDQPTWMTAPSDSQKGHKRPPDAA